MDTRIALTGAPTFNIQQAERDNAQTKQINEQTIKQHYDNLDAREKSRMTSVIAGAAQLKTFLDNEDIEGASNFLSSRKNSLMNRIGAGENIDTQETDAALTMLKEGRIDELKNNVNSLMAAGQIYGVINNKELPSNIQEWQYYNQMTPEDQKRFIQMKRQGQVINLGGSQIIADPTNPAGAPLKTFEVTPKPEDMPDFKGAQAEATAQGKAQGERTANAQKQEFDGRANRNYLAQALKLLPESTSGGVATAGKIVKGGLGISDAATQADRKLNIIAAKLTGTVPRFEGPQGVLDVELYKQAAGDLANTNLPAGDREAAAQFMLDLLDQYGATGQGAGQPSQNSGPVIVTNPQTGETLEIDAADLKDAMAEGFVQQ